MLPLIVLNFEVGETRSEDDDATRDGVQRHVDFFVVKTIFPENGHCNGPTWTLHRLVAVFFRRLPIFVAYGEVSGKLYLRASYFFYGAVRFSRVIVVFPASPNVLAIAKGKV